MAPQGLEKAARAVRVSDPGRLRTMLLTACAVHKRPRDSQKRIPGAFMYRYGMHRWISPAMLPVKIFSIWSISRRPGGFIPFPIQRTKSSTSP